jgi:RNA polymerase sigma factor (TIGR02999 family)
MRLAYDELHRIAVGHFRHEPPGRTLQPTALVHEAFIRLIGEGAVFKNRRYFFAAASKAMRRILVDSARRRRARKRGGDLRRVDFNAAERVGFEQAGDLLDFHATLRRLGAAKPVWAEAAELRVFGGWSTKEVATILGIGESTARRRWAKAKNWIRDAIANPAKSDG